MLSVDGIRVAMNPEDYIEIEDPTVQTLLDLADLESRCAWLRTHVPQPDEALLTKIHDAVERTKRLNPHLTLQLADVLDACARVWQDDAVRAESAYTRAKAFRHLGKYEQAVGCFETAIALHRQRGDDASVARVTVGYVDALLYLGHYEQALHYSAQAEQVFVRVGDQARLAKVLSNRGNVLARLGRFEEARQCYARAREAFRALGDWRRLMIVNINDANVHAELNAFREAVALLREARRYFEDTGESRVVAQIDVNMGYLAFAQGQYQSALRLLQQARSVFEEQALPVEVAYVDLHRSDCYLALNLWHEALETAQAARACFEAHAMNWEAARLWLNEAIAVAHLRDVCAALQALDQAQALFSEQGNVLWSAVADLHRAYLLWRKGAWEDARTYVLAARERFADYGVVGRVAECDVLLGEMALADNDLDEAQAHFQRVDMARVFPVAYRGAFGLGQVAHRRGQRRQAERAYKQAIAHIEQMYAGLQSEMYQMAFLQDKLPVYDTFVQFCLEEQTPQAQREAFSGIERAKSRALLDLLTRLSLEKRVRQHKHLSPHEKTLWRQMDDLKRELHWYYNRFYETVMESGMREAQPVSTLMSAIADREARLARLLKHWHVPEMAATPRNPVWTVRVEDVQQALPQKSALLEFYISREGEVILFGITHEQVVSRSLSVDMDTLKETLQHLRFTFNKFGYGAEYRQRYQHILWEAVHRDLRTLYAALIAPIETWLDGIETLVIVPHGLFHYIPFHALTPDGETYLLDQHIVTYAPSATLFCHTVQDFPTHVEQPPLLLGIHDASVPYVEAEVNFVRHIFPEATAYVGDTATLNVLRELTQTPACLHLATHAVFRSDNPFFSALKLADGWFFVSDVYEMQTMAPLVTLSACETGRAHVAVGDELVGLCRGFFAAGARSVVVSLWMVDDISTAKLMKQFYAALAAGMPVASALRHAQHVLREWYPHPYYWAPFVVMGNPFYRLQWPQ